MKNIGKLVSVLLITATALTSFAQDQDLSAPLHKPKKDYRGSPEKPLTQGLINQLYELNNEGKVLEAWKALKKMKDGYAHSAVRIFGKSITMEKCTVETNWHAIVGEEVFNEKFMDYAKLFQKHYIDYLNSNHKYPNTLDIEKMYQQSDDEMGLPQSVSVDLMFNLVPIDWKRRLYFDSVSSMVGIGRLEQPKYWYHYTEISRARISSEFITAQDIDVEQAKDIYRKANVRVAKCMAKKIGL